jgi:hypothetical protein
LIDLQAQAHAPTRLHGVAGSLLNQANGTRIGIRARRLLQGWCLQFTRGRVMKVGAFCQGAYVRTNSLVRKHIRCFFGCSNQGYDSVGVRESPLHRAKRPPSRVDFGTPPFSQPTYDVIMIFSQCSCHKHSSVQRWQGTPGPW